MCHLVSRREGLGTIIQSSPRSLIKTGTTCVEAKKSQQALGSSHLGSQKSLE